LNVTVRVWLLVHASPARVIENGTINIGANPLPNSDSTEGGKMKSGNGLTRARLHRGTLALAIALLDVVAVIEWERNHLSGYALFAFGLFLALGWRHKYYPTKAAK
jgi:hypothetical protein